MLAAEGPAPFLVFVTSRGSTALHYAALADNEQIMSALIQAGADPLIVNAQGFKPSQFAERSRAGTFKVSEHTKWYLDTCVYQAVFSVTYLRMKTKNRLKIFITS